MKKTINIYKPVGETPLELINKFKEKNKEYNSKKMSYAGRLDPMAEGVLLVLVGEENKKIKQYMSFDKEYRAEILIGISTDSHDVLGLPKIKKTKNNISEKEELIKILKKNLKKFKGNYNQKIPEYSSYKIKGKPLFYYARKGEKTPQITKKVIIKNIKINSTYQINASKLLKYTCSKIDKVQGDFRQSQIKQQWSKLLNGQAKENKFIVIDTTINCSSGTYIRAIAQDLGKDFAGGLLLSLKRLRVGKFNINDSIKLG